MPACETPAPPPQDVSPCVSRSFLWFWTADDEVAFHVVKFKQRAPGFDVDLASDNKTLAVANHDGAIRLYEMAAEKEAAQADEKA